MTRGLFIILVALGMVAEVKSAPARRSSHLGHQMVQGACIDLTSFELDPASTSLARKWRRDGGGDLLVYRAVFRSPKRVSVRESRALTSKGESTGFIVPIGGEESFWRADGEERGSALRAMRRRSAGTIDAAEPLIYHYVIDREAQVTEIQLDEAEFSLISRADTCDCELPEVREAEIRLKVEDAVEVKAVVNPKLKGLILWNEQPAGDVRVSACRVTRDVSGPEAVWKGCSSRTVVRTDASGRYTFDSLEPGEYALFVQEGIRWTYVRRSRRIQREPTRMIIEDEETTTYRYAVPEKGFATADTIPFAADLRLFEPRMGVTIRSQKVDLWWDEAPAAAWYEVAVRAKNQDDDQSPAREVRREKVTGRTRLALALTEGDCAYEWSVTAFNAKGTRIAENRDSHGFVVEGHGPCRLR